MCAGTRLPLRSTSSLLKDQKRKACTKCLSDHRVELLAGAGPGGLLVYSRVGVGLTGVLIVGLSVLAALGLCSLFGMWATLIILEVRATSLHPLNASLCQSPPAM